MRDELISKIEILDNGEMYIVLASGGRASYQMIYREGREVYWDNVRKGFKSPKPRKWTYVDWFNHIVEVTGDCGIKLHLSSSTEWKNIPQDIKNEILC